MRRCSIVPLTLLILSTVNFALAVPVQIPEGENVSVDVAHVPKDEITVLGKRGDEWNDLEKLLDNLSKWWVEDPEPSSTVYSSWGSAPLESNHGPVQVHVPPTNPAPWTESNGGPESLAGHPPTPSTASSSESIPSAASSSGSNPVSDPDREEIDVGHDAPPPDSDPEALIESGHLHTLPSSPGSESESALKVGNPGESSNTPSTVATNGILRRGAGMSLPGLSAYSQGRKKLPSRGSANLMDEGF